MINLKDCPLFTEIARDVETEGNFFLLSVGGGKYGVADDERIAPSSWEYAELGEDELFRLMHISQDGLYTLALAGADAASVASRLYEIFSLDFVERNGNMVCDTQFTEEAADEMRRIIPQIGETEQIWEDAIAWRTLQAEMEDRERELLHRSTYPEDRYAYMRAAL